MRICAIDIGSNSVRCLIADLRRDGDLAVVDRGLEITRLGEGMGGAFRISTEAAGRTAAAVERYASLGKRAGADRYLLFGTCALREAENAVSFINQVRDATGFDVRILTAEDEARLIYLGVSRAAPADGRPAAVIDIGGGSTEFIIPPKNGPPHMRSAGLGCVRLTEKFIRSDPPRADELAQIRQVVREAIPEDVVAEFLPGMKLIGAGGTVTTAACLLIGLPRYDPGRIHGKRLSLKDISSLSARLGRMPLSERKEQPCLEPGRADIIVAGMIILEEIMRRLGAEEITASDEGILHGAVRSAPCSSDCT